MNHFPVLAVVLCAFVGCNCAQTKIKLDNQGKYITELDKLDLDALLANDNLVKGYIECLLEGKRCTIHGKELRALIPDALDTNCAKCTDLQKEKILKVYKVVHEKYAEDWSKLLKQWNLTREKADDFLQIIASKN